MERTVRRNRRNESASPGPANVDNQLNSLKDFEAVVCCIAHPPANLVIGLTKLFLQLALHLEDIAS
jgi:hypothetical protein